MSKKNEEKDAEFSDEDIAMAEEPVAEPEPEPELLPAPESIKTQRHGSGGIAWLALFLSF